MATTLEPSALEEKPTQVVPRTVEVGGSTRFRRVAEPPFNLVFEARP